MENSTLNRIKGALADNQKSSKWLAQQLGKSPTTVSRWASNKVQPSVGLLYEIAEVLNVDVRTLLVSNREEV